MGPAAGFDEHGDLVGHRQSRGSARTELTHQVGISHRLPTGCGCSHARAVEGRSHSLLELLRQRLHGSSGRDRAYGTRSCTATLAEHDRMPLRRVLLLSESQAGRRIAAKGYRAVHDIDIGRVASAGGDRGTKGRRHTGTERCSTARSNRTRVPRHRPAHAYRMRGGHRREYDARKATRHARGLYSNCPRLPDRCDAAH